MEKNTQMVQEESSHAKPAHKKKSKLVWIVILFFLIGVGYLYYQHGSSLLNLYEKAQSRYSHSSVNTNKKDSSSILVVKSSPVSSSSEVTDTEYVSQLNHQLENIELLLNQLNEKIETLDQKMQQSSGRQPSVDRASKFLFSLVSSAMYLREAVFDGKDFTRQLAAFKALAREEPFFLPDITILNRYTGHAIPSKEQIYRSFLQSSDAILRKHQKTTQKNWYDKISYMFSNLVRIRRKGEYTNGNSVEDIIARTGLYIEKGDIDEAVNHMQRLAKQFPEPVARWLSVTKHYLQPRKAANQLFDRAINYSMSAS